MFYDPPEPLDDKIFSPIHSVMQFGLGSSSTYYATPNHLKNSCTGVEFHCGSSESDADTDEFLASILNQVACEEGWAYEEGKAPPNTEPVNSDGLYSGSDADGVNADEIMESVAPLQVGTTPEDNSNVSSENDVDENRGNAALPHNESFRQRAFSSGSTSGEVSTGVTIRTCQPQNQPSIANSAQGIAPRRIRLQCKFQVLPLHCGPMSEDQSRPEDHELKTAATEVRSLLYETTV